MHCGRLHNLSRTEMQRYATTKAIPCGHVIIPLLLLHSTIQCILFLVCPARRKIMGWDGPGKADPLEPGEEINSNEHNQIVCLSLQHQPLHYESRSAHPASYPCAFLSPHASGRAAIIAVAGMPRAQLIYAFMCLVLVEGKRPGHHGILYKGAGDPFDSTHLGFLPPASPAHVTRSIPVRPPCLPSEHVFSHG